MADVIELARQHDDAFNSHDAGGARRLRRLTLNSCCLVA